MAYMTIIVDNSNDIYELILDKKVQYTAICCFDINDFTIENVYDSNIIPEQNQENPEQWSILLPGSSIIPENTPIWKISSNIGEINIQDYLDFNYDNGLYNYPNTFFYYNEYPVNGIYTLEQYHTPPPPPSPLLPTPPYRPPVPFSPPPLIEVIISQNIIVNKPIKPFSIYINKSIDLKDYSIPTRTRLQNVQTTVIASKIGDVYDGSWIIEPGQAYQLFKHGTTNDFIITLLGSVPTLLYQTLFIDSPITTFGIIFNKTIDLSSSMYTIPSLTRLQNIQTTAIASKIGDVYDGNWIVEAGKAYSIFKHQSTLNFNIVINSD